ncbi:hypothetical protein ACFLUH_00440 [Chloroflexota bacterium]
MERRGNMTSEKQNNEPLNEGDIVCLTIPKLKKFIDWKDCANCNRDCKVGDHIFPLGTFGVVLNKHMYEITETRFGVYLFKSCRVLDRVIEATSDQLEIIGTCKVSIKQSGSCENCQLRYQCLVNNWGLPRYIKIQEYV